MSLVKAGGKLMKERGFAGASVDKIMRAEGLTGAAMYSHFDSKAAMLAELLSAELERSAKLFDHPSTAINLKAGATDSEQQHWALSVMHQYLSLAHARDAGSGCAFPSLTQELPRQDDLLREIYEHGVERIVHLIAMRTERPAIAAGIFAMVMGAVSIARALPNDQQAQAVLDSAKSAIAELLR